MDLIGIMEYGRDVCAWMHTFALWLVGDYAYGWVVRTCFRDHLCYAGLVLRRAGMDVDVSVFIVACR